MTAPTLLVLAAGMGTRYGGLKQIDAIGPSGETLMDYSILDAHRAGFAKVVFVIRRDMEQPFREVIASRYESRIAVDLAFQQLDNLPSGFTPPAGRTKPWGTTHALLAAAELIREPFAAINADDFYGAQSFQSLARHLQSGSPLYAMVGFTLRNTLSPFGAVARALCHVDADGFLRDIEELKGLVQQDGRVANIDPNAPHPALTGDELVSMNMWGFTPAVFPQFRDQFQQFLQAHASDLTAESYLPNAVNQLVASAQARVRVLSGAGTWFGVTYHDDRRQAAESIRLLIEQGAYPRSLWK